MKENIEIIINSLLYILNKFENNTTDSHKLFKILYFAEQKHLKKYGKSITSDCYVAMKFGPVPSYAFDIVNCRKGKSDYNESIIEASKYIDTDSFNIIAKKTADLEWISVSEAKLLDESFEENKNLTFSELTKKSHDSAWDSAYHIMDKCKIAEAGGADESILNYINSKNDLESLTFL
ncbi:MAG: Panacea domain-containing protein [Aquaticitalea sp.]